MTLGLVLGRSGFGFDFGRNFICCGFFFIGSSSIGNFFAGRGLLRQQLLLQLSIFLAFILGAAAGTLGFQQLGYDAVLINGIWVALVSVGYAIVLLRSARGQRRNQ